jgi:hypothetical protein
MFRIGSPSRITAQPNKGTFRHSGCAHFLSDYISNNFPHDPPLVPDCRRQPWPSSRCPRPLIDRRHLHGSGPDEPIDPAVHVSLQRALIAAAGAPDHFLFAPQ